MIHKKNDSRRRFIKQLSASAAWYVGSPLAVHGFYQNSDGMVLYPARKPSVNDQLNIGLIGAGGMGVNNVNAALKIPGIKLIAVCDLYKGRLVEAKHNWGNDITVTCSYRELLEREDIDAVIIATSDHWHHRISVDAMLAGKHVYCEKPMVHSVQEGPDVIQTQQQTGKVFQVGSQGVSSLGVEKAKELLAEGAIGDLNYVEGFWARNSPTGAWRYPIPEDASTNTVDWETFIQGKQKLPFDATRFFRWRNYRDYGTGMSGDLFVHLFSSLHYITGSYGPERIFASGGLRYWKDGREVPDVLIGIFDYARQEGQHSAFNLFLRSNFVDGTSESNFFRLVGNEGAMDVGWNSVTLQRNKRVESDDPFFLYQEKRAGYIKDNKREILPPAEFKFTAEPGYLGAAYDHFLNFFTAIRSGGTSIEDAVFGYRAAVPALLCNESLLTQSAIRWNPEQMKLV